MKEAKVKALLPAHSFDMGGFPVKQPFPTRTFPNLDPFLLLHHAQVNFNANKPAKQQGVGPHPHRGFSPVTFVIEGEVHHRDSFGNNQIAKKGEVQWMYAGAGIVHSERPSQDIVENHGKQEIIQLWINTPAAQKMLPPSYQYLTHDTMAKVQSEDGLLTTKVIAGNFRGSTSTISAHSAMHVLWSEGKKGGHEKFEIPTAQNAVLYLIHGSINIAGYGLVDPENGVVFESGSEVLNLEVLEDNTQFVFLTGEPLNEKIEQYGPFVMNNQTQILQAMRDYEMGKMGVLIED
jgi:redox-sensitive bicupin YhaK (pirin superfamily)